MPEPVTPYDIKVDLHKIISTAIVDVAHARKGVDLSPQREVIAGDDEGHRWPALVVTNFRGQVTLQFRPDRLWGAS
jgi:hypothetical protein